MINVVIQGINHRPGFWPVFVLLLVAVTVPAAGVLWFMNQAMSNQRLAIQQKLENAYRDQLVTLRNKLQEDWNNALRTLQSAGNRAEASSAFAKLVSAGVVDSIVFRDQNGEVLYPVTYYRPVSPVLGENYKWNEAQKLEYQENDPAGAARLYGELGNVISETDAQALQAQARCLVKAGKTKEAIEILTVKLSKPRYRDAVDGNGRLVVPDSQLHALKLMIRDGMPATSGVFRRIAERLLERLNDYTEPAIPIAQRLFIAGELQKLFLEAGEIGNLAGEALAGKYLEAEIEENTTGKLLVSPDMENTWRWTSPDYSYTALLTHDSIISRWNDCITDNITLSGVKVDLRYPGRKGSLPTAVTTTPVGHMFPDWVLALYVDDDSALTLAASRQKVVYAFVAILIIVAMFAVSLLTARYVRRQMKLTRLKNDFVATVSHELKTPLTSIRVLTDTLLDDDMQVTEQARKYLYLIAKENTRLSRLIDNFLSFSRMERGKSTFDMSEVRVQDVISDALQAADRFISDDCSVELEVDDDLPMIAGDKDALVTLFINLLENAVKYSRYEKAITVCAFAGDGNVIIAVSDKGIGMTKRKMKKIFDPFTQVDSTLSRIVGGAGLGLSIVRFIVDAHKGSINVESKVGQGSVFTVTLPICVK